MAQDTMKFWDAAYKESARYWHSCSAFCHKSIQRQHQGGPCFSAAAATSHASWTMIRWVFSLKYRLQRWRERGGVSLHQKSAESTLRASLPPKMVLQQQPQPQHQLMSEVPSTDTGARDLQPASTTLKPTAGKMAMPGKRTRHQDLMTGTASISQRGMLKTSRRVRINLAATMLPPPRLARTQV